MPVTATPMRRAVWLGPEILPWSGALQADLHRRQPHREWEHQLWDIDLSKLGTLEVVRSNDGGGQPIAGAVDTSGVNVNINPMIIRGNRLRQQIFINGGGNVVVQGRVVMAPGIRQPVQPAAAAAQDADAAAVEQVTEVRPVGDRVLVSTSNGRLLSAEIGSGRVAWQTRLAERPIDRLVATEDFTVAKVSDDVTCRLFALDTYSGRVIGAKPFPIQNNNQGGFSMVPVNLALSADGTLVYTLPDRLLPQGPVQAMER